MMHKAISWQRLLPGVGNTPKQAPLNCGYMPYFAMVYDDNAH